MAERYDELETRAPAEREAALMASLPLAVAHAKDKAPGMARLLAGIAPAAVTSRAALADLPVLRKAALIGLQEDEPPFAGLTAHAIGGLARLYLSPGPIADPEMETPDWWRFGRALFAAGFRPEDRVLNCFSYHFTPAGSMVDSGARAVGCPVFPGGTGNTDGQVDAIARFGLTAYAGTPDFLQKILEKADARGIDAGTITKACVSGGPLFPNLRQAYADRGIAVRQCYGTADLGLIAYESEAMEGMIVDERVIVEIVRPGTGDPVPEGEVGEVVVTTLNPDYPLIRFGTGDLSAILPGESPCGRTNMRIKGWMGRADQTTKVKGMFVHPDQVARVVKAHAPIARARLIVTEQGGQDAMTLRCEVADSLMMDEAAAARTATQIEETLQREARLRGTVELVSPGTLPNDGKVIEDTRSHG